MYVRCPYCDNPFELSDGASPVEGQHILCPWCNKKFSYEEPESTFQEQATDASEESHVDEGYEGKITQIAAGIITDNKIDDNHHPQFAYWVLRLFVWGTIIIGVVYLFIAFDDWVEEASARAEYFNRTGVQPDWPTSIGVQISFIKSWVALMFGGILRVLLHVWKTGEKTATDTHTLLTLKCLEVLRAKNK